MSEELYANRKHKDTVFRMLYSDKRAILELYNALNGTDYQNPDDLTVTTLENAVYLSMKNDVSFLLDERMPCTSISPHGIRTCPCAICFILRGLWKRV